MTCDAVGGVWQYANDLARGLASEGAEVVLAVLGPGALPIEVVAGVTVVDTRLPLDWLASGPDQVLAAGRALAALATRHRADLVHLNSPTLAAADPFPAPVVTVAHGCVGTWFAALSEAPSDDLAWHEELVRKGLHAADAIAAPSASYAALLQRHYGLQALPKVIFNGRSPAAGDSHDGGDHVLTAGRLWDRAKNTSLLDEVAALLPVPLRAAGPTTGPRGDAIAPEHLQLLGTLSEGALFAEYAQALIFVSAARFEPFGLAVLEAAQAGCPLVLSGIDTFRELWTGAALLVPDNDPAAYAAAIERIRIDPALRAHLSDAARLRASRYSVEAMTAGTLELYGTVLARPQARAA